MYSNQMKVVRMMIVIGSLSNHKLVHSYEEVGIF